MEHGAHMMKESEMHKMMSPAKMKASRMKAMMLSKKGSKKK